MHQSSRGCLFPWNPRSSSLLTHTLGEALMVAHAAASLPLPWETYTDSLATAWTLPRLQLFWGVKQWTEILPTVFLENSKSIVISLQIQKI